jgi:hypothetical protein
MFAQEPNDPKIETSADHPKQEVKKTPEELRDEQITNLSAELDRYDGPTSDRELDIRIREINSQYAEAAGVAEVSGATKEQLAKQMSAEIDAVKEAKTAYKEKQRRLFKLEADDFISSLEALGVKLTADERAVAMEILTSPQIVHIEGKELYRILKIDKAGKTVVDRLSTERSFYQNYTRMLAEQLREEDKGTFSSEVKLAEVGELKVYEEAVSVSELSDREMVDLGNEKIGAIVRDIVNAKGSKAGQGMFWNALVPKEIPYVLKTQKKQNEPDRNTSRDQALLRYPVIRDAIGGEFLPKQAVIKTADSEQLHILQEKIPLDEMISIGNGNIDKLIDRNDAFGAEIKISLEEGRNKEILQRFVEGFERLTKERGLVIDTTSNNLFFKVKKNGELEIKLVDYGAFDTRWGGDNKDLKESLMFVAKLRKEFLSE